MSKSDGFNPDPRTPEGHEFRASGKPFAAEWKCIRCGEVIPLTSREFRPCVAPRNVAARAPEPEADCPNCGLSLTEAETREHVCPEAEEPCACDCSPCTRGHHALPGCCRSEVRP